jgi:hypothetical protein
MESTFVPDKLIIWQLLLEFAFLKHSVGVEDGRHILDVIKG